MANPENELPRNFSLGLSEKSSWDEKADDEAGTPSPDSPALGTEQKEDYGASTSNLDESSRKQSQEGGAQSQARDREVEYRYLTFHTSVPSPQISALPESVRASLPAPPDLQPYMDPLQWPYKRKSIILAICCVATIFTAYSAGSYSPASPQMTAEWHVSHVALLSGITAFTSGFAIAPMALAPLSEVYGRRLVFLASGLIFVASQVGCGGTGSFGGFLVARFFVGVGGSTFSTMVGGVVSDIYAARERNAPMALFAGAALFGTGLGPMIGGFLAQNVANWRWIFWLQAIVDGTIVAVLALVFKETRGSVLLSRKAKVLNAWYEELERRGCTGMVMHENGAYVCKRIRWKVSHDEQRASLGTLIRVSLSRPFHLLLTEPILFSISLWVSFSWAVLYLTIAAIPLVYETVYNFDTQASGAVFASICIGSLIFTFLTIYQERFARFNPLHRFPPSRTAPEHRLIFVCFQSFLLPVGMFIFGFTAKPQYSPALPALGLCLSLMGIFSVYLAAFNFLADVYGIYASSALAAQSFCRNMAGGALPLVTVAMYNHMGYPQASSLLGGIAIGLGIVPWVLLFCGEKIRSWSKFAVQEERIREVEEHE